MPRVDVIHTHGTRRDHGLWIEIPDEGDRFAVEAQQLFRIEGRMELVAGLPGKDHVLRSKSLHGGDQILNEG